MWQCYFWYRNISNSLLRILFIYSQSILFIRDQNELAHSKSGFTKFDEQIKLKTMWRRVGRIIQIELYTWYQLFTYLNEFHTTT